MIEHTEGKGGGRETRIGLGGTPEGGGEQEVGEPAPRTDPYELGYRGGSKDDGQKYPEKQCEHGYCLNHDPDFEVKEVKLRWLWGGLTGPLPRVRMFLFKKHCGQRMLKMEKVRHQKCRKCGSEREKVVAPLVASCKCCEYHKDVSNEWQTPLTGAVRIFVGIILGIFAIITLLAYLTS